jgi:hypothetical protein
VAPDASMAAGLPWPPGIAVDPGVREDGVSGRAERYPPGGVDALDG